MNRAESRTLRRGHVVLNLGSLFFLELIYYGWVAGGVHNPVAGGLIDTGIVNSEYVQRTT